MAEDPRRGFYLGRYNCFERIGTGPLGETFRAKIYGVAGFEKQLAVKRLHAGLCADEDFVARFVNAATAYASLDHERVAKVHEVNVQGAQYYVAVDLVKGLDLGSLLDALATRGEALARDAAMVIALDAADALGYAHARRDLMPSGVLHLGLSPHTIIITNDGEVRLLDVGLLGSLVRLGWADDDQLLPALSYLPPEQFRAGPLDTRADVFSLGAVLHELLGGRRAFPGDSAREVRSNIEATPPAPPACDARLQALIIHMLQAEPDARVASMDAVREALVPLLGSRTARARADLGQLVRRITRPHLKTGSFASVAVPSLGASAPPPPPIAVESKPWSPPKTSQLPTVKLPPPPAPHGPELSNERPRNTFAGLGADDQALVLELVDQLPGHPTERAMPAVTAEELARHKRNEADIPTTPFEKLPENGQTSGSYELYSVGDSSPTLPSLRDGSPAVSDPLPPDEPVTAELLPPRPQDESITAPVERIEPEPAAPALDRAATPLERPQAARIPMPAPGTPEADRTLTPRIPAPAVPKVPVPPRPLTSTVHGRPMAPIPGGPTPIPIPPVSPGLLPPVPPPAPTPPPEVATQPTMMATAPELPQVRTVSDLPPLGIRVSPPPETPAPQPPITAPMDAATMHMEAPILSQLRSPGAPAQETIDAPTGPLPALVPEVPAPPVRVPAPAPAFSPPTLKPQAPSGGRGVLIALALALVLVGGGAALYFGVFRQRPRDETTEPPHAETTTPRPDQVAPPKAVPPTETAPKPTKPDLITPPKAVVAPTAKTTPVAESPPKTTPVAESAKTDLVAPPTAVVAPPKATPVAEVAKSAPAVVGEPGLEVVSTPPGAVVFVDGENKGATPLSIAIKSGEHKLVVLGDGFKMVQKSAKVAGAIAKVEVELEPAKLPAEVAGSAGLKVRCHSTGELRIMVDGADSGRQCPNDVRISVTPGTHKIGLYSARTGQTYELEKDVADAEYSTRVYVKY